MEVPLGRTVKTIKFGLLDGYKTVFEELAGFRKDILVSNQTWAAIRSQVEAAVRYICDQRCAEPRSRCDHRQHCVLASTAVAPVYRWLPEHCLRCMARRFMGLRGHLRSARADFAACTVPMSESQHPGY